MPVQLRCQTHFRELSGGYEEDEQRIRTQDIALSVAALRKISTCFLLLMSTKYEEITDMDIKRLTF